MHPHVVHWTHQVGDTSSGRRRITIWLEDVLLKHEMSHAKHDKQSLLEGWIL